MDFNFLFFPQSPLETFYLNVKALGCKGRRCALIAPKFSITVWKHEIKQRERAVHILSQVAPNWGLSHSQKQLKMIADSSQATYFPFDPSVSTTPSASLRSSVSKEVTHQQLFKLHRNVFEETSVSCCIALKFFAPIMSNHWRGLRVCFDKMPARETKLQVFNDPVEM